MSDFGAILKLDAAGVLTINKPEIKEEPVYKALFLQDKSVKKTDALMWFMYIYLVVDIRSKYFALSLEERKKKAAAHTKIGEMENNKFLLAALKQYEKDQSLTSTAKAFITAEQSFYSIGEDVAFAQETILFSKKLLQNKMKELLSMTTVDEAGISLLTNIQNLLKDFTNTQDKLLSTIDKYPKTKETVDAVRRAYAEEGGSVKRIYGGGELGNREE